MTEQEIKQERILCEIREMLIEAPEFAGSVADAMTDGLVSAQREHMNRAADMETVAMLCLHKRAYKGSEKYIASLLRKWEGKTAMVFTDELLKGLEK